MLISLSKCLFSCLGTHCCLLYHLLLFSRNSFDKEACNKMAFDILCMYKMLCQVWRVNKYSHNNHISVIMSSDADARLQITELLIFSVHSQIHTNGQQTKGITCPNQWRSIKTLDCGISSELNRTHMGNIKEFSHSSVPVPIAVFATFYLQYEHC